MKKLKLELEYDYDFFLIGISSHGKDFRLCWEMNQLLGIDFERTMDFEIVQKDNLKVFPFFEYVDVNNGIEYVLIKNRGNAGLLLPEETNSDYLFVIKGAVTADTIKAVSQQLIDIKIVLTAYPIEVNKLKSKENLIF